MRISGENRAGKGLPIHPVPIFLGNVVLFHLPGPHFALSGSGAFSTPSTTSASYDCPSSRSSSTLSESTPGRAPIPWVSPDCPPVRGPNPRRSARCHFPFHWGPRGARRAGLAAFGLAFARSSSALGALLLTVGLLCLPSSPGADLLAAGFLRLRFFFAMGRTFRLGFSPRVYHRKVRSRAVRRHPWKLLHAAL